MSVHGLRPKAGETKITIHLLGLASIADDVPAAELARATIDSIFVLAVLQAGPVKAALARRIH